MAYAGVEIANLDLIVAKCRTEPLLKDALRDLLATVGEATEKKAIDRAPVGTGPGSHGSITAAISMVMDTRPIPLQVAVEVRPLEHDGFRYAWALDVAQSWVHRARTGKRAGRRGRYLGTSISVSQQGAYHYTAPSRHRKTTRRWFTGALDYKQVRSALEKAARDIERKWIV